MDATAQGSEADEQATREMPRVEPPATDGVAAAPGGPATSAGHDTLPARDPFAERPEYYVGAAFVGGLIAARILKRLGR